MPIQPPVNLTHFTQRWHQVFRPDWETMIGLGYVKNAGSHTYSLDIHTLAALDGKVSFFGGSELAFDLQPWPTDAAKSFYAVSTSASDTGTLVVYGLDATTGTMASVSVTLTGTTPKLISTTLKHVNACLYKGGNDANVGAIFVSTKSTAGTPLIVTDNVQCSMSAGWGYTVNPTMRSAIGEAMVFPEINISTDKLDGVEVEIWCGLSDGSQLNRQKVTEWYLYEATYQNHFGVPIVIRDGEWIRLTIERSSSGVGDVNATADLRHYGLYDADTFEGASALYDQG